LGYLLGKNIGGVTAIVSYRPGGWMQQSTCRGVLSFRWEAREALGSEATRFHHACRQRGCGVAANRARATAGGAGGRVISDAPWSLPVFGDGTQTHC